MVPGLILSIAFVVYIVARARTDPTLAPPTPVEELSGWARFHSLVRYVLPLVSIFVVVIGAMSGGIATPTKIPRPLGLWLQWLWRPSIVRSHFSP